MINSGVDWGYRTPVDDTFKDSTKIVIKSGINLPQNLDNIAFLRFAVPTGAGKYLIDGQQVKNILFCLIKKII